MRENGRRDVFMTKSPRNNVPDVGIELGAACMPSEHASDRATAPGIGNWDLISDFYLTSLQLVLCRVAAVKRLPVHQP